jgi:hypothetical protein
VTPTIIGLCIAGYFAVGYVLSLAACLFLKWDHYAHHWVTFYWPLFLLFYGCYLVNRVMSKPHRVIEKLHKQADTPAPIQEPGAFGRPSRPAQEAYVDRWWERIEAAKAKTPAMPVPLPAPPPKRCCCADCRPKRA